MLKALKTLIHEIRTGDQRSIALELALEESGQLGQLVKTVGVGPTLLLIKSFAGKTLQLPDLQEFSVVLEAAAAAVEIGKRHPIMLRKKYSKEVRERATRIRAKLDEVEAARQVLVQKLNSLSTD